MVFPVFLLCLIKKKSRGSQYQGHSGSNQIAHIIRCLENVKSRIKNSVERENLEPCERIDLGHWDFQEVFAQLINRIKFSPPPSSHKVVSAEQESIKLFRSGLLNEVHQFYKDQEAGAALGSVALSRSRIATRWEHRDYLTLWDVDRSQSESKSKENESEVKSRGDSSEYSSGYLFCDF